jgi:quercetin dioxygenase-like cupin family protein
VSGFNTLDLAVVGDERMHMGTPDLRSFRRVITGRDTTGRSRVVIDGPPAEFIHYDCYAQIWGANEVPVDNARSGDAGVGEMSLAMPGAGSRFWVARLVPGQGTDRVLDAPTAEVIRGMGGIVDPDDAGMHWTNTIDYVIVLAGEVVLVLDEEEVELRPFDSLVQRGTSHRWENRTNEDALIALFMLDAEPMH